MTDWKRGGSYMTQFLHLKAAGDVLNAVGWPNILPERDITRAMACIQLLRPVARGLTKGAEPGTLFDLCCRRGILAVLAAHLLPYKTVFAVEMCENSPPLDTAMPLTRRFTPIEADIYKGQALVDLIRSKTGAVLASSHANRSESERIVHLYQTSPNVLQLVLLPDVQGHQVRDGIRKPLRRSTLDPISAWALDMALWLRADVYKDSRLRGFGPRVLIHARRSWKAGVTEPAPSPPRLPSF